MSWLHVLGDSLRDLLGRRRVIPEPVRAGQPATVQAVLDRLREIDRELGPGDGVWQFNRMYLRVTELVAERIGEGFFGNPVFLTRLDVVFAGLYLEAVAAARRGGTVAPCWEPVVSGRKQPLAPVQFAVAGMNAHINHDLPLAMVRTCRQLGVAPGSRGVRADYDRVTLILSEVHEEVRRSLLEGPALDVDRELSPLVTLVGAWSVARARDAAWVNTEVLWSLRHAPELEREFRATLSRTVGLAGRTLLTPVASPV